MQLMSSTYVDLHLNSAIHFICIRIVNVIITSYCVDRVLREFARCLALMPNLQTVQIMEMLDRKQTGRYPCTSETTHFKREFETYTFPSVRKVILPLRAHGLFACFPNARFVILNHGSPHTYPWIPDYSYNDFDVYVTEAAKHCQEVQYFSWFDEPYCKEQYRRRQ